LQKEFTDFYRNRKFLIKKRALNAKLHLDNREKKDNLAKEKMERERLKYLKRNKIEKYINILREANDIFS
jgi:hypothetical protein